MFQVAAIFRNRSPHYVARAMPGTNPSLPQSPELAERGDVLVRHFLGRLEARLAVEPVCRRRELFSVADITALVTHRLRALGPRIKVPEANTGDARLVRRGVGPAERQGLVRRRRLVGRGRLVAVAVAVPAKHAVDDGTCGIDRIGRDRARVDGVAEPVDDRSAAARPGAGLPGSAPRS